MRWMSQRSAVRLRLDRQHPCEPLQVGGSIYERLDLRTSQRDIHQCWSSSERAGSLVIAWHALAREPNFCFGKSLNADKLLRRLVSNTSTTASTRRAHSAPWASPIKCHHTATWHGIPQYRLSNAHSVSGTTLDISGARSVSSALRGRPAASWREATGEPPPQDWHDDPHRHGILALATRWSISPRLGTAAAAPPRRQRDSIHKALLVSKPHPTRMARSRRRE